MSAPEKYDQRQRRSIRIAMVIQFALFAAAVQLADWVIGRGVAPTPVLILFGFVSAMIWDGMLPFLTVRGFWRLWRP